MRPAGRGLLRRAFRNGLLLALALLALAPAAASAATFTVNEAGDDIDDIGLDGVCDTNAGTPELNCTLRAAVDQADFNTASHDTIKFAGAIVGQTLVLGTLDIDSTLTINGGDCGDMTLSHKPCVGLDFNGGNGLVVNGVDDVLIKGLSITDVNIGVFTLFGTDRLKLQNSWIGIELDGDASGTDNSGVVLRGNDEVIGGTTGAERNVFGFVGDNAVDAAITLEGSDDARVRGNYFGVAPNGIDAADNTGSGILLDGATDSVIGASASSSAQATTKCDGGCNVIANSSESGVLVESDAGTTTIKGNFIGLDRNGTNGSLNGNVGFGIRVENVGTTIGGSAAAERNFIAGSSSSGIVTFSPGGAGITVKRNFVGLNSAGTGVEDAPNSGAITIQDSTALQPSTVARNRIAGDSLNGISVSGGEAFRVIRNKVGLDKNNGNVQAPDIGIAGSPTNSAIGEPGAGNTVGNTTGVAAINLLGGTAPAGDGNTIQGNFVGVDSAGVAHGNAGVGIRLARSTNTVDGNTVGGTSADSENVISNSGDDAIRLEDGPGGSTGNQFKRNRGKANGSADPPDTLFLDLQGAPDSASDGPGNGTLQAGPPSLQFATRTSASGIASPGATVYLFRTSDSGNPKRINAFVAKTVAGGAGDWLVSFPKIPVGQNLTALQVAGSGSSELTGAVAPF